MFFGIIFLYESTSYTIILCVIEFKPIDTRIKTEILIKSYV